MTRDDTIKLLAIIRAAYPKFYANASPADLDAAVGIWCDMLQEYDPAVINQAMRQTIKESPFPPTIADICKRATPLEEERKKITLAVGTYQAALMTGEVKRLREDGG